MVKLVMFVYDFFKVVLEQAIDVCTRFKTDKSLFKTDKPNYYFVKIASENKGTSFYNICF